MARCRPALAEKARSTQPLRPPVLSSRPEKGAASWNTKRSSSPIESASEPANDPVSRRIFSINADLSVSTCVSVSS
eukprot:6176131-Pleurochrysis_carterae.AAC.2